MSGSISDVARYARHEIMSLEPPQLEAYRDAPIYDHAIILQLVAVRPLALWVLEGHLGISSGARGNPDQNGKHHRYSERDLVALLWLRERVVAGEPPHEAGARLVAAQRMRNSGALNSGAVTLGALNSGALTSAMPSAPLPPFAGPPQGRFMSTVTGTLTFGEYPSGAFAAPQELPSGITDGFGATPDARPAEYSSGSWGDSAAQFPTPRPQNPSRPFTPSGPLTERAVARQTVPLAGATSGRLGSVYAAPVPISRPTSGFDPARDLASASALRSMTQPLMHAFSRFDTHGANRIFQQALEQFSVEAACLGLVIPAITRVSDVWAKSELTVPEERFALSYIRSFLTAAFHSTMEPDVAPLVVVGSAQRDLNDLPALLQAVFLRRSGIRVLYLGADAGVLDLADQRWDEPPAVISLTLTTTQRIRSVNQLAKRFLSLPSPRPDLCYTGPIFARHPELQRKVNAIYLGDDPASATSAVRRMMGMI